MGAMPAVDANALSKQLVCQSRRCRGLLLRKSWACRSRHHSDETQRGQTLSRGVRSLHRGIMLTDRSLGFQNLPCQRANRSLHIVSANRCFLTVLSRKRSAESAERNYLGVSHLTETRRDRSDDHTSRSPTSAVGEDLSVSDRWPPRPDRSARPADSCNGCADTASFVRRLVSRRGDPGQQRQTCGRAFMMRPCNDAVEYQRGPSQKLRPSFLLSHRASA